DDMVGQRYLSDLGTNLRSYGARYQFVHTVPFQELQQEGLGAALVGAMQGRIASMNPPGFFGQLSSAMEGSPFRGFDKFIDTAQTDNAGVRHFANGRHFDLSNVSLTDAVEQARDSNMGGGGANQIMRMMAKQGRWKNRGAGALW